LGKLGWNMNTLFGFELGGVQLGRALRLSCAVRAEVAQRMGGCLDSFISKASMSRSRRDQVLRDSEHAGRTTSHVISPQFDVGCESRSSAGVEGCHNNGSNTSL
jgi:hypothetical protein